MSEQAAAADEGSVHVTIDGAIARVTFDARQAHNAMTWSMYQPAREPSARGLRADGNIRAAALHAGPAARPSSPAPTSRNFWRFDA